MVHEAVGVVHVHSTYSDGEGTVEEIIAAAQSVGLDFVCLTDHDTLRAAEDGYGRYHGKSLLIVGTEITPRYNHYLAFGMKQDPQIEELYRLAPQEVIDAVARLGGVGFIAHPDHQGTERFKIPSYAWKDWSVKGFSGMSIWDLMGDWEAKLDEAKSFDVYDHFEDHLGGPEKVSLERWDRLNSSFAKATEDRRSGRVAGFAEIDNHASRKTVGGREFIVFPYEVAFRTLRMHCLLAEKPSGDAARDQGLILDALRRGMSFLAFDYRKSSAGFSFCAKSGSKRYEMGEECPPDQKLELLVRLPEKAPLRVWKDGTLFAEAETNDWRGNTSGPGVYRVEARDKQVPWILSNPVYVR